MDYAKIDLARRQLLRTPVPRPESPAISDADLARDNIWRGEPSIAYWPVSYAELTPSETHRVANWEYEAHPTDPLVLAQPVWEAIPPEELAALRAVLAARPLTPLEFARRLTMAERIGIRASADPAVVDYLWVLDRAQEVRLDDPDTIAGTRYLEQIGLLAAGRADQILAPPA